jgi:Fe2+ transport system protein B
MSKIATFKASLTESTQQHKQDSASLKELQQAISEVVAELQQLPSRSNQVVDDLALKLETVAVGLAKLSDQTNSALTSQRQQLETAKGQMADMVYQADQTTRTARNLLEMAKTGEAANLKQMETASALLSETAREVKLSTWWPMIAAVLSLACVLWLTFRTPAPTMTADQKRLISIGQQVETAYQDPVNASTLRRVLGWK